MSEYPAIDEFIEYCNDKIEQSKRTMPAVMYDYDDEVTFKICDNIKTGTIIVVDKYGTFEQNEEPSYDILVKDENVLYKHIRQSWIV